MRFGSAPSGYAGFFLLLVAAVGGACGVPNAFAGRLASPIAPRVIETRFPTADIVIASAVVEPVDEAADATPAIQAAIDRVAAVGGGVVFLPCGRYRLESTVTLREGVTLRGDWAPPPCTDGTVLMPVAGRGDPEGPPAVILERGSGVRECTFWYPDQDPTAIVPYPWTLRTCNKVVGDNVTVMNVTLVNAYQGFKTGPEWNELHTLRNVYGTVLKTAVWIDFTTDIGRLIGVHFSPVYWRESRFPNAPDTNEARQAVRAFMLREGIGVDMGRSDWEYLYDLNIRGYGIGVKIRRGEKGTTNTAIFGSRIDKCGTALMLEDLNRIGLAATGCRLEGEVAIAAPESFSAVAQFNACLLRGLRHAVLLQGSGSLSFQNCAMGGAGAPMIQATKGELTVMGCDFRGQGPHIALQPGVVRARILGNTFKGEPMIENEAAGADLMIAHQPIPFVKPVTVTPDYSAPHPKPAGRALFDVSSYGASPDNEDNTLAFGRAFADARRRRGGTVYVPAGYYRFQGTLIVPTGVELRGCFDVPHHTVSGGSVLMPEAGHGQEDGIPFLRLEPGSGLRGLTVWYPRQNLNDIVPYPWAVRALGPQCWLVDVTLGNAYQGADFWTSPSDGHVIRYLGGGMLRRGLWVSKCRGSGWVEDVQFNPHYALRLAPDMPVPDQGPGTFDAIIDQQRGHLEAMVFGRCESEHLNRNFLYAAYDGIAFRDDGGGAHARVVMHGTDTGSRAAVIEATSERGIEFVNAQLVPLGKYEKGGIITADSFSGRVWFFNTQMWAGTTAGILGGSGDVVIQQMNNLSGGIDLHGGRSTVENVFFQRPLKPCLTIQDKAELARLIANRSTRIPFSASNPAQVPCLALAGGATPRPTPKGEPGTILTGWETGEPEGMADTVAAHHGNIKGVDGAMCHAVETDAHRGKRALRLAGTVTAAGDYYAYFKLFDCALGVYPNGLLRYWIRPMNEASRHVAIDLIFDDGSTLRHSGTLAADGGPCHPSYPRGQVGEWSEVSVPLGGRHTGQTIVAVLCAYAQNGGPCDIETFIDGLQVCSGDAKRLRSFRTEPRGGTYEAPLRIHLRKPRRTIVHYTLDGTEPTLDSPVYEGPIALGRPGLWELRYDVELEDRGMGGATRAELYDVEGTPPEEESLPEQAPPRDPSSTRLRF